MSQARFVLPSPDVDVATDRVPPSPPTSPWTATSSKISTSFVESNPGDGVRDPVLYANTDINQVHPPLFPPAPEPENLKALTDIVNNHITRRDRNVTNPPSRGDYITYIDFVSNLYNSNPGHYMKSVRDEVNEHYHRSTRISAKPSEKPLLKRRLEATESDAKARRTKINIKPAPKATVFKVQIPRAKTASKNKVEKPRAVRAVSIKRPTDLNYAILPDFCPPASTLPANHKTFKVDDPSAKPLDLSEDPDRFEMHESEIALAATLRLNCASYLCCKRRLFASRVEALKIKKPTFKKTDAQKVCQIDVNKASKLWTAYDQVGWLDEKHFQQYL